MHSTPSYVILFIVTNYFAQRATAAIHRRRWWQCMTYLQTAEKLYSRPRNTVKGWADSDSCTCGVASKAQMNATLADLGFGKGMMFWFKISAFGRILSRKRNVVLWTCRNSWKIYCWRTSHDTLRIKLPLLTTTSMENENSNSKIVHI